MQEHKKDSGYSLKSPKYHEAGYDAFITGLCFIAMANRLGLLSQVRVVVVVGECSPFTSRTILACPSLTHQDKDSLHPRTGRPRILPDSPLVAPFTNKLHVMRMSDVPYMDLTGPDPDPPRDHVFHLTFPKEWRLPQVRFQRSGLATDFCFFFLFPPVTTDNGPLLSNGQRVRQLHQRHDGVRQPARKGQCFQGFVHCQSFCGADLFFF